MNDQMTNIVKGLVMNRTQQQKTFLSRRKVKVCAGKILLFYAALPLASAWAVVPGLMMVGIKPTVWAKSKIIDFKEWRRLR